MRLMNSYWRVAKTGGWLLTKTEYSDPCRWSGNEFSSDLFFLSLQLSLNTRARPKSATTAVMFCRGSRGNSECTWL